MSNPCRTRFYCPTASFWDHRQKQQRWDTNKYNSNSEWRLRNKSGKMGNFCFSFWSLSSSSLSIGGEEMKRWRHLDRWMSAARELRDRRWATGDRRRAKTRLASPQQQRLAAVASASFGASACPYSRFDCFFILLLLLEKELEVVVGAGGAGGTRRVCSVASNRLLWLRIQRLLQSFYLLATAASVTSCEQLSISQQDHYSTETIKLLLKQKTIPRHKYI